MPKAALADGEIFYETAGAGPALLLVPGLGGVGAFWKAQVEAFAPYFTVITHDHRGCGQSSHTKQAYSVDGMAADVIGLMDALKIDRAHYIGHSTGGAIGQVLAATQASRIDRLVLGATWRVADPYFKALFAARKRVLLDSGNEAYADAAALALFPPYYIRDHAETLKAERRVALPLAAAPEITASRIDAICAFDGTAHLRKIGQPTLIVVADDDMVTPRYLSDDLKQHLPHALYRVMARGGHMVPRTEAQAFNGIVLPFLRG